MAGQLNPFTESYQATGPISLQQRFVVLDSTSRVRLCQPGEYAEGVLENNPTITGQPATISNIGVTKLVVDAAYGLGTFLVPGTDGIGTQVTSGTYPYVRAKSLEASNYSGDIVTVRLVDEVVGSGVTGAWGYTGIQGYQGNTGIRGVTGLIGGTGIQGLTGLALGSTGIQGITGLYGNTGDVGGTGIQGITGLYGDKGDTGGTGIQGVTGLIAGVLGYTGDIFGATGIYTCSNGLVVSVL